MGKSSRPATHAQFRFRPGVVRRTRTPDRAKLELTPLEDRLALSGTPTVINFDDLASGTVVTTQYQSKGVIFSSAGGAGNVVSAYAEYGGSPPNTLGTYYNAGGSFNDNTYLDFTSPVSGLSFLALADNQTGTMGVVNVIQKDGTHTTVPMIGDNDPYTPSLVDLSSFKNVIRIEIVNVVDPAGLVYDNFTFTVGPSVKPTSLTWDTQKGGVKYTYSVDNEDVSDPIPVALYWASGEDFSTQLGKISGTDYTIPQGTTTKKSPYTRQVDGALLKNAPPGTTHILVVVGDPTSNTFDPTTQVKALQDVTVSYKSDARAVLTDYSIGIIKDALRYAGQSSGLVTSTFRTPHEQAQAMYANILSEGVASQLDLYGSGGDQVINAYSAALSAYQKAVKKNPNTPVPDYVAIMEAKILAVGPSSVSKHCATEADYALRQVFDVSYSQVTNKLLFHKAITSDGRVAKVLDPFNSNDPAFHMEVVQ